MSEYDDTDEKKILWLDSKRLLEKQNEQVTSENLPKKLCMQLHSLMIDVTKKEVTPDSVRAACLCASEIHKILKLNHEIKTGK